ncbi:hypothetical protein RDABS01_007260, partial [Bienertia sinuspersici]
YPFQRNKIEAIYQFGDSISDVGNIIHLSSGFARLPYGQNFFHKPIGPNFFNLTFLEPHLKKDGNFSHGENVVVVGTIALNCSTPAMNSSRYYPIECKDKLGKALIMMGEIGGNDYK